MPAGHPPLTVPRQAVSPALAWPPSVSLWPPRLGHCTPSLCHPAGKLAPNSLCTPTGPASAHPPLRGSGPAHCAQPAGPGTTVRLNPACGLGPRSVAFLGCARQPAALLWGEQFFTLMSSARCSMAYLLIGPWLEPPALGQEAHDPQQETWGGTQVSAACPTSGNRRTPLSRQRSKNGHVTLTGPAARLLGKPRGTEVGGRYCLH